MTSYRICNSGTKARWGRRSLIGLVALLCGAITLRTVALCAGWADEGRLIRRLRSTCDVEVTHLDEISLWLPAFLVTSDRRTPLMRVAGLRLSTTNQMMAPDLAPLKEFPSS